MHTSDSISLMSMASEPKSDASRLESIPPHESMRSAHNVVAV